MDLFAIGRAEAIFIMIATKPQKSPKSFERKFVAKNLQNLPNLVTRQKLVKKLRFRRLKTRFLKRLSQQF